MNNTNICWECKHSLLKLKILVPHNCTIKEYVHRTGNFSSDIVAISKEKQGQYNVWFRSGENCAYASTTAVPQFQHRTMSMRFILWNLNSFSCSDQMGSPNSHTALQTSQKKKLPTTANSRDWKLEISVVWLIDVRSHDFSDGNPRDGTYAFSLTV